MTRTRYSLCPTCGCNVPIYSGDEGTNSFKSVDTEKLKPFKLFIPQDNDVLLESGEFDVNQVVDLLRKYKDSPGAIQFIADMLEE